MGMKRRIAALAMALGVGACAPAFALGDAAADAAVKWEAFLAKATPDDVSAAMDAIEAVGYTLDAVDADKCRAQAAGLKQARVRVPVSLAVQRASLLCAEATGDHAAADRATAEIAALVRLAFDDADRGAWPRPVRIVAPADAYALLASAGLEFRYEMYSQLRPSPYFPLLIAARRADGGVEKMLQFDYVDVLQAIDREDPSHGTPRLRMVYANSFVDAAAKREELSALDLKATLDALSKDGAAAQIDALRDVVAQGGLHAASTWLGICVRAPSAGCGDGLIDGLLPLAEDRQALPMMLLATAYLEGIGVARDQASAEAMLDAADRVWERRGASPAFAEMQAVLHPEQPLAPFLRKRLEASRDAGNPAAAVLMLAMDMAGKTALASADEALLARPEHNSTGQGLMRLAGWYESRDKAKSDTYLQRAADAGNPGAVRILAMRLREAEAGRPPSEETRRRMEQAANDGDTMAMRYLAYQSYMQGNIRRAEDWLVPAAVRSDVDGLFFLASLWSRGYEGLSGGPAEAVDIYRPLAEDATYGARARRELAKLALDGRGMDKNPTQAKAWLTQDAEAGDVESQVFLGGMLLTGGLGKADETAGRKWMERAVAANSVEAMNQYGLWLHNHGTRSGDRARGAQLSRQAADRGDIEALNNAAWMLCVSKYDEVRKPADGMAYARQLEAIPDIGPGTVDTVAACHAAVGDFARAADLQQRVVDAVRKLPESDRDSLGRMEARLALFRAGKPYIEEPADTP